MAYYVNKCEVKPDLPVDEYKMILNYLQKVKLCFVLWTNLFIFLLLQHYYNTFP